MKAIRSHRDLEVYREAFSAAQVVLQLSRSFPVEERYSLTDQIRRSSRSVASNIAETWRKRRYPAAFVSKLSDADSEGAETQVWLEFAVDCGYVAAPEARALYRRYNQMLRTLVGMMTHTNKWCLPTPSRP